MVAGKPAYALNVSRCVTFWSIFLAAVFLASTAKAASIPLDLREIHVLNRLGFGPRPGDIERVKAIGVEQFIREQLAGDELPGYNPDAIIARAGAYFDIEEVRDLGELASRLAQEGARRPAIGLAQGCSLGGLFFGAHLPLAGGEPRGGYSCRIGDA